MMFKFIFLKIKNGITEQTVRARLTAWLLSVQLSQRNFFITVENFYGRTVNLAYRTNDKRIKAEGSEFVEKIKDK